MLISFRKEKIIEQPDPEVVEVKLKQICLEIIAEPELNWDQAKSKSLHHLQKFHIAKRASDELLLDIPNRVFHNASDAQQLLDFYIQKLTEKPKSKTPVKDYFLERKNKGELPPNVDFIPYEKRERPRYF